MVRVFEQLKEERGLPDVLRTDNGPEFLGEVFVSWCKENGVMLEYNEERNHDGLGGLTPAEVLANAKFSTLAWST